MTHAPPTTPALRNCLHDCIAAGGLHRSAGVYLGNTQRTHTSRTVRALVRRGFLYLPNGESTALPTAHARAMQLGDQ